MAWLTGWSYRKEITITGQSGAGTDYQVEFDIGDSTGGDFHLEGHCTNFPQDIAVTDNDGSTPLDFWIEDITADPLKMWVEVADDLGSNQTIYVYYGKSGETTNSSISDTYLFGDDLESGNLNAWGGATSAYAAVGGAAYEGSYGCDRTQADGSWQFLTGSGDIQDGVWEAWVRQGVNNGYPGIRARYLDDSNYIDFTLNSAGSEIGLNDVGGTGNHTETLATSTATWYFIRITLNGTAAKLQVYDTSMSLLQTLEATVADRTDAFGFKCYRDAQFDEYRVRKYNSPEPAFSSAGSEEGGNTSTNLFDGKIIIKNVTTNLLDGKVRIGDVGTDLLDGFVSVQNTNTDLLDGKVSVQNVTTDLLDGKVSVQNVTTDLLDGKVSVQNMNTNLLDGKVRIGDVGTDLLDGKVRIGDVGTDLLDGKVQIKSVTTNLLDGKVGVQNVTTNLFDGKILIEDDITDLLDGKVRIGDVGTDLLDGKVIITSGGGWTGIINDIINPTEINGVQTLNIIKVNELT